MNNIQFLRGDLLDFPNDIQVIAHCCNCQNTFGSGIAKSIKDRYPEAYKVDTAVYKAYTNKKDLLGLIGVASVGDNKYVANLYAQENYGPSSTKWVNYESLYQSLLGLRTWCRQSDKLVLGIPYKMASNRAGGDWNIVCSMIESVFGDSGVEVYIVSNTP